VEAEFHGPDWNLSQHTMAELPDGSLVARMTADGRDALVLWLRAEPLTATSPVPLEQPCVAISSVIAHGEDIAFIGTTQDAPTAVYIRSTAPEAPTTTVTAPATASAASTLTPDDIAVAKPIHLTGRTGRRIHASLYRPALHDTEPPPGQQPPLIVFCHGGPTANVQPGYDAAIQFFTTRGFAVVTPDYAGSSGHGRAYRDALNGQWGVADSHDCLDTALHLAHTNVVDPTRLAIRGGSAGGFTALNALAAGEGFAAGASWYGVTDLRTLAATTHDFEAHYTDRLVGPLPEAAALYEQRSPLTHAATMTGAVLLLQGAEDAVVPPDQAHQLHDALTEAGRPCELRIFEGEGHGFRGADTLRDAYEAELAFYRTHLHL
jgi:dipeptidyl aminopeptidase/acylaminoacyl peptidase